MLNIGHPLNEIGNSESICEVFEVVFKIDGGGNTGNQSRA
jgi:hypothetical protein